MVETAPSIKGGVDSHEEFKLKEDFKIFYNFCEQLGYITIVAIKKP